MMTPANVTTYGGIGGIGGPAGTAEVALTSFDLFGRPNEWGTPDLVIHDEVTAPAAVPGFCSGSVVPGISNCLLLGVTGVLVFLMMMKRR